MTYNVFGGTLNLAQLNPASRTGKNRLIDLCAGRVEEAGALAKQIGREITRRSKRQLQKIGSRPDTVRRNCGGLLGN